MFYSHTFLARKGPLGNVWCAAHLQHRLKKSHIASTDIPSTVERIMFPEVPIALRMSGHLLLGVVRIYSKQVEYLHHDFNLLWVSLRNAFRNVDVNLPENANQAHFNAVTLPETYALDAIDIDGDYSLVHGSQDDHLRSLEEITLQDQYHSEKELYVRITFDDDIIQGSLDFGNRDEGDPMQIDIPPDLPTASGDIHNAEGLDKNEEQRGRSEGESFPPSEVMRDNIHDDVHLHSPILRLHKDDLNLNISSPRDTAEKETDTPQSMHESPVHSHQTLQPGGPSSPPTEVPVVSGSFVNVSPKELSLRPSPIPEKPQPRRINRKRKQHFDKSLVLTNEFLKNLLNDCSDLVKKKKLPCSALELWRFTEVKKKKKKKEEIFSEPLISGMCANLQYLSSKDLKSSHPELPVIEEAQLESRIAESPAHVSNVGEEIEHLRSADLDLGLNIEQILPSSPQLLSPAPHTVDASSSPGIPSSVSEPRLGTTDTRQYTDMFMHSGMDMETPNWKFGDGDDNVGTAVSDIPETSNPTETDKLAFLEEDNNTPPDSQEARTEDTMSVRTRAVAQYLKNHSPLSKFSDDSSGNLNLSTILEGRRRKTCARMFYETLVLKDCGLIDVQQDEPYGDIILKLTPTFSEAKI